MINIIPQYIDTFKNKLLKVTKKAAAELPAAAVKLFDFTTLYSVVELNVFYDITVTMNAFFTIVPSASFTFTLISYVPFFLGVIFTVEFSL